VALMSFYFNVFTLIGCISFIAYSPEIHSNCQVYPDCPTTQKLTV
jgi:hypothetical protein